MIYIKETKGSFNRKSLIRLFVTEKPATYSNAECTNVQCPQGRFRSVTELLEIVQTYYPKTTLVIRDLVNSGENIALIWCTQVNKVVLKYVSAQQRAFVTQYSLERYANSKGVDGYSINDYQTLINNL